MTEMQDDSNEVYERAAKGLSDMHQALLERDDEIENLGRKLEAAQEACKVLKRENEGLRALAKRSLIADARVGDLQKIATELLKAINADLGNGLLDGGDFSPAVAAGLGGLDAAIKALDDT